MHESAHQNEPQPLANSNNWPDCLGSGLDCGNFTTCDELKNFDLTLSTIVTLMEELITKIIENIEAKKQEGKTSYSLAVGPDHNAGDIVRALVYQGHNAVLGKLGNQKVIIVTF